MFIVVHNCVNLKKVLRQLRNVASCSCILFCLNDSAVCTKQLRWLMIWNCTTVEHHCDVVNYIPKLFLFDLQSHALSHELDY